MKLRVDSYLLSNYWYTCPVIWSNRYFKKFWDPIFLDGMNFKMLTDSTSRFLLNLLRTDFLCLWIFVTILSCALTNCSLTFTKTFILLTKKSHLKFSLLTIPLHFESKFEKKSSHSFMSLSAFSVLILSLLTRKVF